MPSLVRCKCKSQCTTYNPLTGLYEGDGHNIPRGTRDNHVKADKRRAAKSLHLVSLPTTLLHRSEVTWIKVFNEELNILCDIPVISASLPLVFANNPTEHGEFIMPDLDIVNRRPPSPNQGLYSLTGHRANSAFLSHEYRLLQICNIVLSYSGPSDLHHTANVDALLERLENDLRRIYKEKQTEWMRQQLAQVEGAGLVITNTYLQNIGPQNPTVRAVSVLSLVLQHIFFVPRRALRIQLSGIRSILHTAKVNPTPISLLPQDPRTPAHHFNVDPIIHKYVSCTSCHRLYPYDAGTKPDNDTDPLLLRCMHARTPGSPLCNTPLWKLVQLRSGQKVYVPHRTYSHHDLHSWIGRLVCQPGVEDLLDAPLQPPISDNSTDNVDDIWQSAVFSQLKDPSGGLFLQPSNGEGRLVFSLSIDSFNPHHNKTAKQTVSSTGIWMVLLNLPPNLRYRREYMYLAGVIPGPDKPSKEDLYPYLDLLVSQLRHLYLQGVRFSKTYRERLGRLFLAMLIPLICDMLAARQTIGLGSATSHHFCTFCDLDIDDLDIADRAEWPPKKIDRMRNFASLWRDAPDEKVQLSIFEASGIRWSPMWELPYWDPVHFTVIDSMHALDLNLLQNQCRSLFQINTEVSLGDSILSIPPSRAPDEKRITSKAHVKLFSKCCQLIATNNPEKLIEDLLAYPRKVLYTFCLDHNVHPPNNSVIVGTKVVLAENIFHWRQRHQFTAPSLATVAAASEHVPPEDPEQESDDEHDYAAEDEVQPNLQDSQSLESKKVTRIIRHLVDLENPEESKRKAKTQGSKEIFQYICELLQLEYDAAILKSKRQLYDLICDSIDDNPEVYDTLRAFVHEQVPNPTRAILDQDVMHNVWGDMENTLLPSWISQAPRRWGTTQHGKLSADNWRVICTIHLPITLIRLWGRDSGRRKQLLDHFMDLVAAVQLANMKVMTRKHIEAYGHYIHRYISNITSLYPDQKLKPSHHMARHLEDTLQLFGPVHSHKGDHYERFINLFHGINTNKISGQLEETLLRMSARMANVQALIRSDTQSRAAVFDMISKMDQIQREDARGARLASMLDPSAPTFAPRHPSVRGQLSEIVFQRLWAAFGSGEETIARTVEFVREISKSGVCYSTVPSNTSRNSVILYLERPAERRAYKSGIIRTIFQHPSLLVNPPIFLVVEELLEIGPADNFAPWNKAYRSYAFGGYLARYPNTTDDHAVQIIHVSQIISHCALTQWANPLSQGGAPSGSNHVVHVLPLDRMGLLDCDIEMNNLPLSV